AVTDHPRLAVDHLVLDVIDHLRVSRSGHELQAGGRQQEGEGDADQPTGPSRGSEPMGGIERASVFHPWSPSCHDSCVPFISRRRSRRRRPRSRPPRTIPASARRISPAPTAGPVAGMVPMPGTVTLGEFWSPPRGSGAGSGTVTVNFALP